jgi:DNA modification methylase
MLRILQGDALEQLRTLPVQSVQCCVTSPPYWSLRDYGTAQWEGGEHGCDHKIDQSKRQADAYKFVNGQGEGGKSLTSWTTRNGTDNAFRDCPKCGARRIDSQLGLEATPEEYIANMVAVFREVWRVLRDDGTLWLNMGDSYAGTSNEDNKSGLAKCAESFDGKKRNPENWSSVRGDMHNFERPKAAKLGLKPKDLCMMPARVALALQADGWYLRSDIIWHKLNPMPESVTDRPTKAHEYIFLLTKAERYFYDAEAIREESQVSCDSSRGWQSYAAKGINLRDKYPSLKINRDRGDKGGANFDLNPGSGRNKRTVWTIATQPYAEAHFATFPEEIPKLCILAGSKPGDTVLDPFAGSGTTGQVALELGRRAILIELNPKYVQMIEDRTSVTIGMF